LVCRPHQLLLIPRSDESDLYFPIQVRDWIFLSQLTQLAPPYRSRMVCATSQPRMAPATADGRRALAVVMQADD
jgi:hypothetical protein